MDTSFFQYMQQLELMAFFSGYPLIYAVVNFATGNQHDKRNFWGRSAALLPVSYALVGTLYLGLQLKNLFTDPPSVESIQFSTQLTWLVIWALLSITFWIPALRRKPVLSLLHSLVFFFSLLRDLFLQFISSSADENIIRNDMKIYTDSLLLNLGSIGFIILLCFIYSSCKKRLVSS